jgi:transcription elongation factor Elf1
VPGIILLTFSCTDLSAAVDVYSDWVDACDAVAKQAEEDGGHGGDYAPSRPSARANAGRARDREDDDDDIIDDRDDDGYGGEGIVADDEEY